MAIEMLPRPYVLTFAATGATYPLSSQEAQRLVDEYPLVRATAGRVILRADDGTETTIRPATLGGGPAFRRVP